jgi:hypothetical protein
VEKPVVVVLALVPKDPDGAKGDGVDADAEGKVNVKLLVEAAVPLPADLLPSAPAPVPVPSALLASAPVLDDFMKNIFSGDKSVIWSMSMDADSSQWPDILLSSNADMHTTGSSAAGSISFSSSIICAGSASSSSMTCPLPDTS